MVVFEHWGDPNGLTIVILQLHILETGGRINQIPTKSSIKDQPANSGKLTSGLCIKRLTKQNPNLCYLL